MKLYFTLKMALNALATTSCGYADDIGHNHWRGGGDYDDGDRQRRLFSHKTCNGRHRRQHRRNPAGSVNIAGVATGSGSVMTLSPQDAEAILKECPCINWGRRSCARARRLCTAIETGYGPMFTAPPPGFWTYVTGPRWRKGKLSPSTTFELKQSVHSRPDSSKGAV